MSISSLWQRLTNPSEHIQQTERRRRAHLLASLMIVLIPFFVIPELARAAANGHIPIYFFGTTAFLILAYWLSRTRHYRIGVIITLSVLSILPIAGIMATPSYDPERVLYALIWTVPTVLLGSLLLPLRHTTILIVINLGLILALPLLNPSITAAHIGYALGFLLIICALLLLASVIRRNDLLRIESQARSLTASEQKFRSLVENSPAGIFRVNQLRQFTYVNDQLCRILGHTETDILGRNVLEFVQDGDQLLVTKTDGQPQPTSQCECSIVHPDGLRQVEVKAATVVDKNGRLQTIAQMLDITARKEAEEAREQLIAELNAFSHTVAHDLKNPLALTKGYAELLLKNPDLMASTELPTILNAILSGATKMQAIINDLMLLSTVRKMDKIKVAPLAMGEIVDEALSRIPHLVEQYHATLTIPADWPSAVGYAPWIEAIWSNYLSNAIKYGGRPPAVTLGATREADNMIRFWIRDNGNGLTPAEQDILFKPFTRLGQNDAEGHGLGLSIVHRIVEKLGGEVGIESEGSNGSVFSFTLPANDV